jgi:predicted amino acid racemase
MNRLLSCLIVLGLATGLSACDKKEKVPLPKMAAGDIKQQAKLAVGAVENAAKKEKDEFVAAVENDVREIKAEISALKSKATKATGKAKATMAQRISALEEELKIAQQKLTASCSKTRPCRWRPWLEA